MAWNPCEDLNLNITYDSPLWTALQTIYDSAYPSDPLPRMYQDSERLDADYIVDRQGISYSSTTVGYSLLPKSMRNIRLGPIEIDILDWMLNCPTDKMLYLVGPRGAGKSSLVHYIEYVLSKSELDLKKPTLLVIDLFTQDDRADEPTVGRELAKNLSRELRFRSESLPKSNRFAKFRRALQKGARQVTEGMDCGELVGILESVKKAAPWNDPRAVVVFFDNLDPLSSSCIDHCIGLVKQLAAADLKCAVSVRPSSYNRIIENNAARALITSYIRVSPPSIQGWLEHFPDRMERVYRLYFETNEPRKIEGYILTSVAIRALATRITMLLSGCIRRDNTARFMEALSSHDMRHFNKLMRRLLQNRNLPSIWLLAEDDEAPAPLFHPMYAIMQGQSRWFAHGDSVPNLLVCITKNRSADLLLFHRALSILGRKKPAVEFREVLLTMSEYGYDEVQTIQALEALRRANVVYGSNLDIVWTKDEEPQYCGLTESGVYFLDHLLSDSDYLVSAVLDIPLNHEYLRSHLYDDAFASQVHSLYEYLLALRQEENRQITFMRRRPPSDRLSLAADRLRRGNTLYGKVLRGFSDVIERGTSSTSSSARSTCLTFHRQMDELRSTEKSLEKALDEVMSRALKRDIAKVPPSPDRRIAGDESLEVRYSQDGSFVNATFEVRAACAAKWAFIVVWHSVEESGRYPIVNLSRMDHPGILFKGELEGVAFEETPGMLDRTATFIANFDTTSSRHTGFSAVLDVSNAAGNLRVVLIIDRNGNLDVHELGSGISLDVLLAWTRDQMETVGKRSSTGHLERGLAFGVGKQIAQKALSDSGVTVLGNLYNQIRHCWLMTDIREIPWEWLVAGTSEDAKMLCDKWIIRRTHVTGRHENSSILHTKLEQLADGNLKTVGLDKKPEQIWRGVLPTTPTEAMRQMDKSGLVHVVAHASKPGELRFGNSLTWELTPADVIGYTPGRKKSVREIILSSCKCGAQTDPNMAIQLARSFGSPVWAPLVDIDISRAEPFDARLGEFFNAKTIEDAHTMITKLRDEMPFLYAYVCYA